MHSGTRAWNYDQRNYDSTTNSDTDKVWFCYKIVFTIFTFTIARWQIHRSASVQKICVSAEISGNLKNGKVDIFRFFVDWIDWKKFQTLTKVNRFFQCFIYLQPRVNKRYKFGPKLVILKNRNDESFKKYRNNLMSLRRRYRREEYAIVYY